MVCTCVMNKHYMGASSNNQKSAQESEFQPHDEQTLHGGDL